MTLLLDTQAFLWFLWDDPKLSSAARAAIVEPENRILVSIASCWEIAIKVGIGKLSLGMPTRAFLAREIGQHSFELLPISLDHAMSVETLPPHHRDPFDRLLVAQAMCEGVAIVSADSIMDAYRVGRVW